MKKIAIILLLSSSACAYASSSTPTTRAITVARLCGVCDDAVGPTSCTLFCEDSGEHGHEFHHKCLAAHAQEHQLVGINCPTCNIPVTQEVLKHSRQQGGGKILQLIADRLSDVLVPINTGEYSGWQSSEISNWFTKLLVKCGLL